ncbi:hypothetical protein [Helicobacter saguini]|nr:hypothetical protein [Helicobacter saguini]
MPLVLPMDSIIILYVRILAYIVEYYNKDLYFVFMSFYGFIY